MALGRSARLVPPLLQGLVVCCRWPALSPLQEDSALPW